MIIQKHRHRNDTEIDTNTYIQNPGTDIISETDGHTATDTNKQRQKQTGIGTGVHRNRHR